MATLLFDLAEKGDAQRIIELLKSGANPNDFDERGSTPLMIAPILGMKARTPVMSPSSP